MYAKELKEKISHFPDDAVVEVYSYKYDDYVLASDVEDDYNGSRVGIVADDKTWGTALMARAIKLLDGQKAPDEEAPEVPKQPQTPKEDRSVIRIKWNPVATPVPLELNRVFVTIRANGYDDVIICHYRDADKAFISYGGVVVTDRVIAWAEMPKPYNSLRKRRKSP